MTDKPVSYGSTTSAEDPTLRVHAVDVPTTPEGQRHRPGAVTRLVPRLVGMLAASGLAVLAVVGGGFGSHTPPDRSYDSSVGKTTGMPVGDAARADLVHLGEFRVALPQEKMDEDVRHRGSVDCSVLRDELCVKVWNETMCYTTDDGSTDDYTEDTINICGGIDLTSAQAMSGNYSNNTCFTGCSKLRTICSSDDTLDDICPVRHHHNTSHSAAPTAMPTSPSPTVSLMPTVVGQRAVKCNGLQSYCERISLSWICKHKIETSGDDLNFVSTDDKYYSGADSVPTGGRKLGTEAARSIGDRDSPFDDDEVTYDICGGDGNGESSCWLSCYELKDVCDNHYFEYCPEFSPTAAPAIATS